MSESKKKSKETKDKATPQKIEEKKEDPKPEATKQTQDIDNKKPTDKPTKQKEAISGSPPLKFNPVARLKSMNEHSIPLEELYKRLGTDPEKGLTFEEAEKRVKEYGLNALRKPDADKPWYMKNLKELIVSLVFGGIFLNYASFWFVALIIGGSILMFYLASQGNDYDEFSPEAMVFREGDWHEIESGRVAIGDILRIRTGEQIAADARIIII